MKVDTTLITSVGLIGCVERAVRSLSRVVEVVFGLVNSMVEPFPSYES